MADGTPYSTTSPTRPDDTLSRTSTRIDTLHSTPNSVADTYRATSPTRSSDIYSSSIPSLSTTQLHSTTSTEPTVRPYENDHTAPYSGKSVGDSGESSDDSASYVSDNHADKEKNIQ